MARPRKYEEQKLEAYKIFQRLSSTGKYVSAVDIEVDLEEGHPEGVASPRLIASWLKEFKGREEYQTRLDMPFRWYGMEDVGLPLEASSFLLSVLGEVIRSIPEDIEPEAARSRPTYRDALWWWRIHLACPEIHDLLDIQWLAAAFTMRELRHEVLERPLVTEDLEAVLALKPWLSEDHHESYHDAVDSGAVPEIHTQDGEARYEGVGHPELLHSQQVDYRGAEWKRGSLGPEGANSLNL
jgi:hypothetical protein